jgi:hypothetical protein
MMRPCDMPKKAPVGGPFTKINTEENTRTLYNKKDPKNKHVITNIYSKAEIRYS